jgi:GAF domain-containing protein
VTVTDHVLTRALSRLGRIVLAEKSLDDVLNEVAQLAKETLVGAEAVSVTVVTGPHARSAAFTGSLAIEADELQYRDDSGPCLDAAQGAVTVSIPDMGTDGRWPRYAPAASGLGVGSSMSIPLPVQQDLIACLNVYGTKPNAFDDDGLELAAMFASYAAVAITNAHLYTHAAATAAQLQEAMQSRAVIEQAKGIIMGLRQCSADDAFTELVRESQNRNVKVRDVAAEFVQRAGGKLG